MMWFTHITFGLFLGLLSLRFVSPGVLWLYLSLVCLAALLPDIDHPHSLINKKIILTRWASHLFKHRGFFHSVFPVFILYLVLYPISSVSAVAISLGYLSHIVIDGLTRSGVNLLYPLATLRVQGFMETGSVGEWVVFGIVLVGIVALVL